MSGPRTRDLLRGILALADEVQTAGRRDAMSDEGSSSELRDGSRRYTRALDAMSDEGSSSELRDGSRRYTRALDAIVAGLGGVGARVIGTTRNGAEHRGVLESAGIDGLVVRDDGGKRYRFAAEWERYNTPDPGCLSAPVRKEISP